MNDPLTIYAQDHLAGTTQAIERLARARGALCPAG